MAMNFPNNPTIGDTFIPVSGKYNYIWNGVAWEIATTTATTQVSYFVSHLQTTYTLPIGTTVRTKVPFNTPTVDVTSNQNNAGLDYDYTNSVYVAPVNGMYQFTLALHTDALVNSVFTLFSGFGIFANASDTSPSETFFENHQRSLADGLGQYYTPDPCITAIKYLSAGSIVGAFAAMESGTVATVNVANSFSLTQFSGSLLHQIA